MTNQNAACTKFIREIFGRYLIVRYEEEVRRGGKYTETVLAEDTCRSFSVGDHTVARFLEPCAVLPRSDSGLEGKPADWVGIEAILYTEQRLDEVTLGDGKAKPQAGKASRFRERLDDDEIFIVRHQVNGALGPKIDIRFVDEDDDVRVIRIRLAQCTQYSV